MKTIRMLFTAALLLGVASIYAQAENVPFLRVSIPFDFTVDNQTLPAGDYTISDWAINPRTVVWLQSSDGKHVAALFTHSNYAPGPSARTKLIFQHVGSGYFLSQIWKLGETTGRELPRNERAKELAKNGESSDIGTIVADASFRH